MKFIKRQYYYFNLMTGVVSTLHINQENTADSGYKDVQKQAN